jgi:hypothetical protein
VFDKEVRSTYGGICAAIAKVGAIIGAYGFQPVAEELAYGYTIVMILCSVLALLGAVLTHVYLEDTHNGYVNRAVKGDGNQSFSSLYEKCPYDEPMVRRSSITHNIV